jgi:hypothetical protein
MRPYPHTSRPLRAAVIAALSASLACACASGPSREQQEAARNAFTCQLGGQPVLVKFDTDEARLLMPDGDRLILYQIQQESGVRYTNGMVELRGSGLDLRLIRNGKPAALVDCKPAVPGQ